MDCGNLLIFLGGCKTLKTVKGSSFCSFTVFFLWNCKKYSYTFTVFYSFPKTEKWKKMSILQFWKNCKTVKVQKCKTVIFYSFSKTVCKKITFLHLYSFTVFQKL